MRIQQLHYIIKIHSNWLYEFSAAKQLFITQPASLTLPETWKMKWALKSLSAIPKALLFDFHGMEFLRLSGCVEQTQLLRNAIKTSCLINANSVSSQRTMLR